MVTEADVCGITESNSSNYNKSREQRVKAESTSIVSVVAVTYQ